MNEASTSELADDQLEAVAGGVIGGTDENGDSTSCVSNPIEDAIRKVREGAGY